MRQVVLLIFGSAVALSSACRSPQGSHGPPRPAPSTVDPVLASTTKGPWVYRPGAGPQAFRVDQSAVIQVRLDSVVRIDTVSSRADVVFAVAAEGTRLAGTLNAYSVRAAGHQFATPAGLSLPVAFSGIISGSKHRFELTPPDTTPECGASSLAALQSLQDLWLSIPDTLRVGATWEDSTAYSMCRDGMPLRVRGRRSYHATGLVEGLERPVLTIRRQAQSIFEGETLRAGEKVRLTGSASGDATYELDPVSGMLLRARISSAADFELRSRLRAQQAQQRNEVEISTRSIDKP